MTIRRALCLIACLIALPAAAVADRIRIATFNTELQRDGPGLLVRDLIRNEDDQITAVVALIARVAPDVIALQGVDWDHEGKALAALRDLLRRKGQDYPFWFAPRPNSGLGTGLDLDGDGRTNGAGDSQGFGRFTGQGGIAVLSRFPIDGEAARNLSAIAWREVPGALLPVHKDGSPFPSHDARAIQLLSSTGHWIVPVTLPNEKILNVLTFQAGPPVFDGPEDRNGRRNHDEIMMWKHVLDGEFGPPMKERFVIAGGANLDPDDGDGRHDAIRSLLDDPRVQDPQPKSRGAQTAPDQGHRGRNALDTVDWPDPGRLRVDYVLPSAEWKIAGAGVFWPARNEEGNALALKASRHRLVWVDLIAD